MIKSVRSEPDPPAGPVGHPRGAFRPDRSGDDRPPRCGTDPRDAAADPEHRAAVRKTVTDPQEIAV